MGRNGPGLALAALAAALALAACEAPRPRAEPIALQPPPAADAAAEVNGFELLDGAVAPVEAAVPETSVEAAPLPGFQPDFPQGGKIQGPSPEAAARAALAMTRRPAAVEQSDPEPVQLTAAALFDVTPALPTGTERPEAAPAAASTGILGRLVTFALCLLAAASLWGWRRRART